MDAVENVSSKPIPRPADHANVFEHACLCWAGVTRHGPLHAWKLLVSRPARMMLKTWFKIHASEVGLSQSLLEE